MTDIVPTTGTTVVTSAPAIVLAHHCLCSSSNNYVLVAVPLLRVCVRYLLVEVAHQVLSTCAKTSTHPADLALRPRRSALRGRMNTRTAECVMVACVISGYVMVACVTLACETACEMVACEMVVCVTVVCVTVVCVMEACVIVVTTERPWTEGYRHTWLEEEEEEVGSGADQARTALPLVEAAGLDKKEEEEEIATEHLLCVVDLLLVNVAQNENVVQIEVVTEACQTGGRKVVELALARGAIAAAILRTLLQIAPAPTPA